MAHQRWRGRRGDHRGDRVTSAPPRAHLLDFAPLAAGIAALVVGTAAGWNGDLVARLISPPPFVRLALAIASLIGALVLLGAAVGRMESRTDEGGHLVAMLRGIRLAFLAIAALSMAIGWALGSGMPFVVALVIAGVDVLETSFLIIVVRRERP